MCSQFYPYPEIRSGVVAARINDPVADPFAPSTFEDTLFAGELAYEYLARETNSGPQFPNCSTRSRVTGYAASGSAMSLFTTNDPSFPPTPPSSPPPLEPPSPQHTRQPPPKSTCRQGTPSFDHIRGKWSCSVCHGVFHDKYECGRHIGNVGKRVVCLACGKVLCGRRDNRKRHYVKYCKRAEFGREGCHGIGFEDAFVEVCG